MRKYSGEKLGADNLQEIKDPFLPRGFERQNFMGLTSQFERQGHEIFYMEMNE